MDARVKMVKIVIAATPMHVRTVVASLTVATDASFNSCCSSVARCAALATLDSIDVKLYELLPFCTPQLYKFS
jgi:hypothetical protein